MTSATKPRRTKTKKSGSHPAIDFINCLCHTGDWWGKPFALRPWQEEWVRQIFGPDGKPKYREVFIAIPRKNGKTELAGAINDYLLCGTGRQSQRIFSGSGTTEQASLIYEASSGMIRQSQALSDVAICYDSYKRINVNAIERTFTTGNYTHVVFKGRADTLLYKSHDLFDLIKGTIPR